jgi:tricorn protease
MVLAVSAFQPGVVSAQAKPHIYQRPALSKDLIAFGYAGDLWTVPREGGRAVRMTKGSGIETAPVFSPDGGTIAFTGDYDGNTGVFTIPSTGGIPHRVTYHPAGSVAVGWTSDGKQILFRSVRDSSSTRYTQLFTIPAQGGIATRLPLPMAYQGQYSPDGSQIAYQPLAPAFGFNYTSFVAWGNYHGGLAATIWVTTLPGLDSVEIPHETAADFSPVWVGKSVYFLSGRKGHIGIFRYDTGTRTVTEALHNDGPDIRTLSGDGSTLIYDQLGEIYFFDPSTGQSHKVPIDIDSDFPEVRPRIDNVAGQVQSGSISSTGLRAAFDAHGEIFTVPAKEGPTRDITNTPGVMEREPAWSPDGQSIAYFSDESGLYALHVAPQTGDAVAGAPAVKKFPLANEPAYYFDPEWSPDSKRIVFQDNRLNLYMLDTTSGKLATVGEKDIYAGFWTGSNNYSWSADSKWIAYTHTMANHAHAIFLYSVETGKSTQVTSEMADSTVPAFDRDGKYLYFLASTNDDATTGGIDMTADLYQPVSNIYAMVLAADQASPLAPELYDEKAPSAEKSENKSDESGQKGAEEKKSTGGEEKQTSGGEEKKSEPGGKTKSGAQTAAKGGDEKAESGKESEPKPVKIDLDGIQSRIVALPLPARNYIGLKAGLKDSIYFLQVPNSDPFYEGGWTLSRWTLEDRKTEKLAENVKSFDLSADGKKMLLEIASHPADADGDDEGGGGPASWFIAAADAPVKPGEGKLNFGEMKARVDPHAEWEQMYHEVWRIERAYFYDPSFHGTDTAADEKRLEPYVASIVSRADLNYIFQEMLSAFSVGHMRGHGGEIPEAKKVPGGLLGADYEIKDNHYCIAKIYTGGDFNPRVKAPLAQPGLNVAVGDCILAINGQELTAAQDIQELLEDTAGRVTSLRVAAADGKNPRNISVTPVASEAQLRNIDWIEANRKKVDKLSEGKLAYVYLPDTEKEGFINFNRYYLAQTDKQGVVVDERFNSGGQVADYFIEVMSRKLESYWTPRYGVVEHSPTMAIYGPKVMLANEFSGSGGDALPWLFKEAKLGPVVGKRTWGGLVGIGETPVLMDGGEVTAPSVAFFSPKGEWDVENHGVDPDYVVDQDPKAMSEGHDPQLEKAVSLAMEELGKQTTEQPKKPEYPNYHK